MLALGKIQYKNKKEMVDAYEMFEEDFKKIEIINILGDDNEFFHKISNVLIQYNIDTTDSHLSYCNVKESINYYGLVSLNKRSDDFVMFFIIKTDHKKFIENTRNFLINDIIC